jgi:hypothetical protein
MIYSERNSMAIHGYKEDGQPMFDDIKEYAGYLKAVDIQEKVNRNKFDWCSELLYVTVKMSKELSRVEIEGITKEQLKVLDRYKGEIDTIYKNIINSPIERLDDIDIIEDYLGTIEVLNKE